MRGTSTGVGPRAAIVAVLMLLLAGPVGCADDGSASSGGTTSPVPGSRLIVLTMTDHRFEPRALTAKAGETVTLRFVNNGTVRHEAVIGDETVQAMHAEMMASMTTTSTTAAPAHGRTRPIAAHPGMNAPNVVSVEAGATGEVTYSLAKQAHLIIGCHEIGHYEDGMHATLDVV